MKRILSLVLVLSMMLVSNVFAATGVVSKSHQDLTITDMKRLVEIAEDVNKCGVSVINFKKMDKTTCAIRLQYDRNHDVTADYIVTVAPYVWDNAANEVKLSFDKDSKNPNWYYFGLFSHHNIDGFGIAKRVKRYPAWTDLTYTGATFDGETYVGAYDQICDLNKFNELIGK